MHSHQRELVKGRATTAISRVPALSAGRPSRVEDKPPTKVSTATSSSSARMKLLGRIPAMVVELARDGTVLFANEMVAETVGYSASQLEGRNLWRMLCPGKLGRQMDSFRLRLAAGDLTDREIVHQTKDGSLRTVAWSFSASARKNAASSLIAVGKDVSGHKLVADELQHAVVKLREVLESTIEAIAMTVELRDPYTAGHQRRVAALACAIGRAMRLTDEQLQALRLAGTIHDIGKIAVPLEVLSKRDLLTADELELLKAHSETGYAILKTIDFPWPIADIVHQHHERVDGSGYPLGLRGNQILIESKILAVCDVVESMAGPRPYRQALGIEAALAEISRGRANLYQPEVVDACMSVISRSYAEWE